MPRGSNPNSKANLKKFGKDRDPKISGKKGALKSAEAKRAKGSLTEAIKNAVTPEVAEALVQRVIEAAQTSENPKWWELVRDQLGEKPTEKVALSTVNEEAVKSLQEAIQKRRCGRHVNTGTD